MMPRYKIILFVVLGIVFAAAASPVALHNLPSWNSWNGDNYYQEIDQLPEVKKFRELYPEHEVTRSVSTDTGIANVKYSYMVSKQDMEYPDSIDTLKTQLYIKYDLAEDTPLESELTCIIDDRTEKTTNVMGYLSSSDCITHTLQSIYLIKENVNLSREKWDHLLSLERQAALYELEDMFEKRQKLFMDVSIVGVQGTYEIGDPLEFVVAEAGYGTPCTYPRVVISQEGQELSHYEYRLIHSCPFFKDEYPVLSYMGFPHNNRMVPPITDAGEYTITAYSLYNATDSKQFAVLPSDFVYEYTLTYTKRGNSTGNTTLELNLNDGSFIVTKNSETVQNILPANNLADLVQLIDDTDILRGSSSMHYELQESCRDCINHHMTISLGDYTHFVRWQNDESDMNEKYIPIVELVENLLYEQTMNEH